MAIIESELPIDPMTYTHFTKFLLWYGVKTSEMRTKPQMKHKYKTIREIGEDAPVVYCKRTSSDEEDLTKLKSKEVAIGG